MSNLVPGILKAPNYAHTKKNKKFGLSLLSPVPPLPLLSLLQSQWEKRVLKSLNSMCMELGQSLARPRCQNEQQELISEQTVWPFLSHTNIKASLETLKL